MSLSTTDRIKLRQINATLKAGQDVKALSQEDKEVLNRVLGSASNNTSDVIADIAATLEEGEDLHDAIVDSAILKTLTEDHLDALAREASLKSATTESQKQVDQRIYKHILQKQMMKKIRQVNDEKLRQEAERAIIATNPKNPTNTGDTSKITTALSPTIDSLIETSGFTPTPEQRQQLYDRMTIGVLSGTTDPTNHTDLAIAFSLARADIDVQYAQTNPIAQRREALEPTVLEVKTADIETQVKEDILITQHDAALRQVNLELASLLSKNGYSQTEIDKVIEAITPEIAATTAQPNVTQQDINQKIKDLVNSESAKENIDKKLETTPESKIKPNPDAPVDKQTQEKIKLSRTTYSQDIIGEISREIGADLTPQQKAKIAATYITGFQLGRLTQEQAIDKLTDLIQKETGLDRDKIRDHIEQNHSDKIWAVKKGFNNEAIIDIPSGVVIKIKENIKSPEDFDKVLRAQLNTLSGLSQKDLDRLLQSKEITDQIKQKLENDQALQLSIRRVYTDAIYTDQQKQIYKAFFSVYGDQISDNPTKKGHEAIVVITALPPQSTISATAVALASMGVTTKMIDDVLQGKVATPEMEKLLKNHYKDLAHIRKQLDALEGTKLHYDIAPSFISEAYSFASDVNKYGARSGEKNLISIAGGEGFLKTYSKYASGSVFQSVVAWIPENKYFDRLYKAADTILHPITALQNYLSDKTLDLLAKALLKGETLRQFINSLIAKGLSKLGLAAAFGFATGGIGFIVMAGLDLLLKPIFSMISSFTKGVWGEELKARDLILAPIGLVGIMTSGLTGVLAGGGLVGTLAANGLIAAVAGLIIYMSVFAMAPLLSTIVHLESGVIGGSAVSPYTGPIIDGCNAIWPMSRGTVIQGPRGTYSHTQVEAIDIATPVGTQVVSISSGKLIFNAYAGVYGNLVKIESPNPNGGTYEVWYGHLAVPSNLSVGDDVSAGQPIAISGATSSNANFANPHLHLEYRRLSYNQCPAAGVPVPNGCYGFTNCGSITVR